MRVRLNTGVPLSAAAISEMPAEEVLLDPNESGVSGASRLSARLLLAAAGVAVTRGRDRLWRSLLRTELDVRDKTSPLLSVMGGLKPDMTTRAEPSLLVRLRLHRTRPRLE